MLLAHIRRQLEDRSRRLRDRPVRVVADLPPDRRAGSHFPGAQVVLADVGAVPESGHVLDRVHVVLGGDPVQVGVLARHRRSARTPRHASHGAVLPVLLQVVLIL